VTDQRTLSRNAPDEQIPAVPTMRPGRARRPGRHSSHKTGLTPAGSAPDRSLAWLAGALVALAILAAAAAAVSWDAQYTLVLAIKGVPAVAALEAGVPDAGALIFAALGIALALQGRRAIRARGLNVACVGISLVMNALAAGAGWRDLAIWIMPSAVYAVASDTLIGVVRTSVITRSRSSERLLADDEATPMALIAGLALWWLRLALAPRSTLGGFRRWVLDECPVAPGRKAVPGDRAPAPRKPARIRPDRHPSGPRPSPKPGKQARLLALAGQRHDLMTLPLKRVSGIANQIGAEVSLSPGTARRVLLTHVRILQNGHQQKESS
jgi:hypothetical protein